MELLSRGEERALCDLWAAKDGERLAFNLGLRDLFPDGAGTLTIGFGEPWPTAPIRLSFRFPSGPVYELPLPSRASMALVRRMIANVPGVSASDIFFDAEVEPRQRLCDFVSQQPGILGVRTSTFQLQLKSAGAATPDWKLSKIFLTDRIFELKKAFAASLASISMSPSNLVFSIGGFELPDRSWVSQFGFADGAIIDVRMLRISF
jgi:hypothetical protein